MIDNFKKWGLVTETQKQVAATNRQHLLCVHQKKTCLDRLTSVFDYTPRAVNIKIIILRYWHVVRHIQDCSNLPKIGFRKKSFIRNQLVRADHYAKTKVFPAMWKL